MAADKAQKPTLQLTNRLSESRSPYVGASLTTESLVMLMVDGVGSRTHEQSGGVADVGRGSHIAGEEAQSAHLPQHRLCRLSL